ncbi:Biopolymer transport protein ExbD [BD1-7 clade bacterium]|uniref:Biopolymer transport protein ExbD n=1 Tax=BD1-7 clade bacterium TaxID=2029982 RepID=A0A5S9NR94_9GAMM|nr:Biopolymer transport protein ExbD [BD1-7 clade bacterium]CAA0093031.1 Biopolymer transport protein ExbD [BD1-7 clade bacterium]CAA0121619.1 Biopolymer transport protein ExbD [BD1-7 clade bacterium]
MSARRHQADIAETELDMTPMLDIVFIMLIFFIVTTSFVKESGIEVNPPAAESTEKQDNATIFVGIEASGSVWIDKREVDVRTVRAIIARLHASNPEGAVVVQADEKTPTGDLMAVMDQVRLAGVKNIAVAASSP